jgi:hypothetical protein
MLKILKKKYFTAKELNKNDEKHTLKKNVSITYLFIIFVIKLTLLLENH